MCIYNKYIYVLLALKNRKYRNYQSLIKLFFCMYNISVVQYSGSPMIDRSPDENASF